MQKKKRASELLPKHIAVIMDGNGRWAERRSLPRAEGHRAGVDAVRHIIQSCLKKKIAVLTLFCFGQENWQRPQQEVDFLMALFVSSLMEEIDALHEQGVRVRVVGDRVAYSQDMKEKIEQAENKTAKNTALTLALALNYSGRWDLVSTIKRLAGQVKTGSLLIDDIDEACVSDTVCLNDVPEPDLLIRTSGELRVSNFLLWQCAYTEFYFTETLWPDFDEAALDVALMDFSARQRRYGRISEEVVG